MKQKHLFWNKYATGATWLVHNQTPSILGCNFLHHTSIMTAKRFNNKRDSCLQSAFVSEILCILIQLNRKEELLFYLICNSSSLLALPYVANSFMRWLFLRIQIEKRSWTLCDRKGNLLFDHLTLLWYLQGDIVRFPWNQNFSKTWKRRQIVQKFPGKVSRNSGNCSISEMRTIQPKILDFLEAKLNGEKTCGKIFSKFWAYLARLPCFWKF